MKVFTGSERSASTTRVWLSAAGIPQAGGEPVHLNTGVIVIGAGLAGLVAAWQASQKGRNVRVLTKGWGATHWASGCIGVLGYDPWLQDVPIASLEEALDRLIRREPDHPFAVIGLEEINNSLEAFKGLCSQAGYPLHGSLESNWLLPSSLGAGRPVCLAPDTMIAGNLNNDTPALIVGFTNFTDFYPHLVAANLVAQDIPAEAALLTLKSLDARHFSNSRTLADAFENDAFRHEVAEALRPHLGKAGRVGFPGVLGLRDPGKVQHELEALINLPIFEIPTLPPSIPGIRLHRILVEAIERSSGHVFVGMEVIGAHALQDKVVSVTSEAAVRNQQHTALQFILATGGILGGGTTAHHNGYTQEIIFNLPTNTQSDRSTWLYREFFSTNGHPIYKTGIAADRQFRPIDAEGNVIYDNVRVIGSALAHCDPIRERSLEGLALATGYMVGRQLEEVS